MNIDLAGIGQILKKKREEKELSVAQVAERLCLRKSLIEAIEAGNWAPLPHEVYVKGFVKEYATLLHAYAEVTPYFIDPEAAPPPPVVETVILPQVPKAEPTGRRFFRARYAVFIILAIIMGIFAYDRMERQKTIVSKTETATRIAEKTPDEAPANNNVRPVSEVKSEGDTGTLSAAEPKRLMITCQERTWISVVIDESEKKEFMLSPHEIIVVNAKEKFDLLIGNAGGVKILLNGKDTEFTGKSGEVKRIQFS
ncbi:MAG TPA: RodZ domain-containing protein [Syntrophorhabdaceae bacterium]|jgi:transcriptional regulator with XRE-family HTH domain